MEFEWDPVKNERLKRTRNVSFEEILSARLVDIQDHPANTLQERMLFELRDYIWVVPFVRAGGKIFLKTIYPSRKYTKQYRKEQ